jgi:hypothetical protein
LTLQSQSGKFLLRIEVYFELSILLKGINDFRINNGTKIAITLDPLTFILSPVGGGEGRVRGMKMDNVPLLLQSSIDKKSAVQEKIE